MAELRVGTSGWIYKHWAKRFYPPGIGRRHLSFYAERFDTVEINGSFYRLPTEGAAEAWREAVPGTFLFAVKGSRFITHMKKLNVTRDSIAIFFERIAGLGQKCGPVLWQLPPDMRADLPRLERFLRQLPRRHRHALEVRHPSWYEGDALFELLRERNVAHVCISSRAMPARLDVTSGLTYLRFHGLDGGAAHDYTRAELAPWVDHARRCLAEGIDVFAYFNNDLNTRAPRNALEFRRLAATAAPRPPASAPPAAPGRTRRPAPSRPRTRRRPAAGRG